MAQQVFYRSVQVDGLSIFYREAGPKDAPTILLLHGLPSSSRMFQALLTSTTWWRPTIRASGTATGPTPNNSLTPSTTSQP
jgi:pimeloyl-ACP methyl ester carboxylesterase